MIWSDYDLNNEATWVPMPAPLVDPFVYRRLEEIAGFNPFGGRMLEVRWGSTYTDPQATDDGLKYFLCQTQRVLVGHSFRDPESGEQRVVEELKDVPASVLISVPLYASRQLGERRLIIEQWRSAEFLAQSGRYQNLRDPDQTLRHFECRACGERVPVNKAAMELDVERICIHCGSKRVSPVDERIEGDGRLLRKIPPEGVYDFFYRVETSNGKPREIDSEVLDEIAAQWAFQQKPLAEKNQIYAQQDSDERIRQRKAAQARMDERWSLDNLMTRRNAA